MRLSGSVSLDGSAPFLHATIMRPNTDAHPFMPFHGVGIKVAHFSKQAFWDPFPARTTVTSYHGYLILLTLDRGDKIPTLAFFSRGAHSRRQVVKNLCQHWTGSHGGNSDGPGEVA